MTSFEPAHTTEVRKARQPTGDTHSTHSNIALDLSLAIAAHGAWRSPCLLMTSAAHRNVVLAGTVSQLAAGFGVERCSL